MRHKRTWDQDWIFMKSRRPCNATWCEITAICKWIFVYCCFTGQRASAVLKKLAVELDSAKSHWSTTLNNKAFSAKNKAFLVEQVWRGHKPNQLRNPMALNKSNSANDKYHQGWLWKHPSAKSLLHLSYRLHSVLHCLAWRIRRPVQTVTFAELSIRSQATPWWWTQQSRVLEKKTSGSQHIAAYCSISQHCFRNAVIHVTWFTLIFHPTRLKWVFLL